MGLPGTYTKVTLHFTNNTDLGTARCVLWYLIGAGPAPTLANVATFANSFRTAYATAVAAYLCTNQELSKVTVKYVAAGSEIEGDSTAGPMVGTETGDILPEEDVFCIQRRTGLVGRNKRGRVFFPYIPESYQSDGDLNTDGKTAAAALATMVKSNVTSGTTTFNPQTPDWKNSVLVPVVQTGYVLQTCSRRDRRSPKQLTSIRI